jgi:hypothetical protein
MQMYFIKGENGDLKNRGIKVEINHIGLPTGEKPNPDLPDSSIGEGMDISIQVGLYKVQKKFHLIIFHKL